ncbi:MAG: hypothetical protein C5B51_22645 [Terriglobia bacterium]|nr:MAG: hypothetical protein C5B51_22645 [Terriglobia bacterium]
MEDLSGGFTMKRFSWVVILAASFSGLVTLHAQWPPRVSPKAPRKPDGKVDLAAKAPRTTDGKPDLSGVWEQYGEFDFPKYLANIAADIKPEEMPLQPWAATLLRERRENNSKDHPGARCLPSGIPEKDAVPAPVKIVQTPDLIVLLYESRTIFRQIFLDGRPLPKDPQPAWQGYSIGRWEGDTLVVETRGFPENNWLDMAGHPGTEQLHVTERFTRTNFGSLEAVITVDDSKAYTKPWSVRENYHLLADGELIEHICEENNKDPQHMVGK